MLLQCATPDAVARLRYTELAQQADELWATYFEVQEHSSLTAFLRSVLTTEQRKTGKGRLIQVKCKNYFFSVEYELGSVHIYPGIFESAAFFFLDSKISMFTRIPYSNQICPPTRIRHVPGFTLVARTPLGILATEHAS